MNPGMRKGEALDGFGSFDDFLLMVRGDCFHFRGDHEEIAPTQLNATLDPSATDGHGHALFGSGNSASGYAVQHNAEEGIEIGMKAHYRTGDTIGVSSVDKHGVLQVDVPSGTQVVDPAHDVYTANPNRAAWNFDFSVATLGNKDLSDFDAHLLIDTDPTAGVKYLDLHLVKAPAGNPTGSHSGYVWETADTHHIVIGDDGGVLNHATQNSFNFAFIKSLIDTDPHTPGVQPYNFGAATFDVELLVNENGHGVDHQALHDYVNSAEPVMHHAVADLHMQFHVGDHTLV